MISMNWSNVLEMPIEHTRDDIRLDEIPSILKYNLNDTLATYEFYLRSKEKIELRKIIEKQYNIPCINFNNGKLGEQLILKLYCDKLNKSIWDVKELRTHRSKINLADCIPNNVKFKTEEFNKVLNFYKNTTINKTKGAAQFELLYKNHLYTFALGGEHGFHEPGVYESNDEYIIKSADVSSLHPNLPIVYNFYPEHLGVEFLEVYRDNIVNVRMAEKAKPKKEQNKAIIDGYKEAANVPYGKSNSIDSFLYDPLYTMKTTIASQMVLAMLCESLCEIPNSQMLMTNTDGCEIRIPRKYENLYKQKCKEWEDYTKLTLEFQDYIKVWMRDINNYGCLNTEGVIKSKGSFEIDKKIGSEPAYHKDNSFRIVPIAISEYFVKGIPVEETIKNHTNIYDFCGRQKFTKESYGQIHYIKNEKEYLERQQKNVRYYITNKGATFIKYYTKGTSEMINKGYQVKIFNRFEEKPFSEYNVNYKFYINEAMKEIMNIKQKNQLKLF